VSKPLQEGEGRKKALQRLEVMKTISEKIELAQLGISLGIPIITLNND
jgi:hypothetical protein